MINNQLSNHLNPYQNNANGAGGASNAKDRHKAGKNGDADESRVKDETAAGTEKESGAKRAHGHRHGDAYAKAAEAKPAAQQPGDTVEISTAAKAQSSVASDADGAKTVDVKNSETTTSETKTTEAKADDKSTSKTDDKLTAEQRRQKELEDIHKKTEADYAAKYPHLAKKDKETADAAEATKNSQALLETDSASKENSGIKDFLNDMPLFEDFKTSLMEAFRSLDSATSGSISAQYQLNYTSMQYIANEAGGYSYTETSASIKLDLNYIKAAGGGGISAGEIADAIENAEDFESFVSVLQDIAKQQAAGGAADGKTPVAGQDAAAADSTDAAKTATDKDNDPFKNYRNDNGTLMSAKQLMNTAFKNVSADGVMKGMADYFSPESTAGRISDFAEALFAMSSEYKNGGDTEEARQAYVDRMGEAIKKGFSEAIGVMGPLYSGSVGEGVDKTRDIVFENLNKFVKGDKSEETDGTSTEESSSTDSSKSTEKAKDTQKEEEKKQALQNLFFSYQSSYSQKTTTFTYGNTAANNAASLLNAQA